jgi:spermidine dehydrogenase
MPKFSKEDLELGLNRKIDRRDFLNGMALTAGAVALDQFLPGHTALAQGAAYPPADTAGFQGQTDAARAVMHSVRDGAKLDLSSAMDTGERYDLVVVGAGISGLASALLYRQMAGAKAKVLVIDPLADFGGHAKRNEYRVGKRTVLGYGGSQSLQTPSYFSPAVRQLLADIGVEPKKFEGYYDSEWADKRGLGEGIFFAREAFGKDVLVRGSEKAADWVGKTPLSAKAKRDLIQLMDDPPDYLPDLDRSGKLERLSRTTYKDFLLNLVKADPQLVTFFQSSTEPYFGVGIEATTCLDAWGNGNPGFAGMNLGDKPYRTMSPSGRLTKTDPDDYIYHFPDGNAGIARALVRRLRPDAVPGHSMEDLVTAKVEYGRLDRPNAPVRIRLNSSVVRVQHLGTPGSAKEVEVTYTGPGGLRKVRAGHVVLACWHRVIPYLTDELLPEQVEALNDQQKVPLMYTNVVLRNWRAWDRLKIASLEVKGHFWNEVGLDFPVSMGAYRFAQNPGEPIVVHFGKVMTDPGKSTREQSLNGRRKLYAMGFSEIERSIRSLLARALGGGGFDPARDIAAITVNRWAHGYAYEYMRPWDEFWPDGPLPIERARKGWGRVAIANSDSGAYAYAHSAIDQAVRAVRELLGTHEGAPEYSKFPGPPLDKLEFQS